VAPDPKPAWFPDERGFACRENLDAGHASRYDEKEDAGAAAEAALLERHGLDPASLVVEFGPGTGQITVALAPRCRRLIAVDVSEPMMQRLAAKLEQRSLANVEIVDAGLLSYEHRGEPADFVYSRLVLHHLPDFWKVVALERIRALLRPGGIFRLVDVVFGFEPGDAEDRLEAWFATGGDSDETEWTRAEFEEHVRDEHSTFTWLLEPMLARAGFEVLEREYSGDGILAAYVLRAPGQDPAPATG